MALSLLCQQNLPGGIWLSHGDSALPFCRAILSWLYLGFPDVVSTCTVSLSCQPLMVFQTLEVASWKHFDNSIASCCFEGINQLYFQPLCHLLEELMVVECYHKFQVVKDFWNCHGLAVPNDVAWLTKSNCIKCLAGHLRTFSDVHEYSNVCTFSFVFKPHILRRMKKKWCFTQMLFTKTL